MRLTPTWRIRFVDEGGVGRRDFWIHTSGHIEPQTPRALVAPFNCFSEKGHRFIGRLIIVARPSPGEMRHLHIDVSSQRQQLFQKHARLRRAIRTLLRDGCAQVHHDCHAVPIGCAEDSTYLFDVRRILELHI